MVDPKVIEQNWRDTENSDGARHKKNPSSALSSAFWRHARARADDLPADGDLEALAEAKCALSFHAL